MQHAKIALLASLAVAALVGPALAQDAASPPVVPPPAARCTGLFCDLYYGSRPVGQPVEGALPCHDFVCGMFGGRTVDALPAQAQQAQAAPEAASEPVKGAGKAKRKKHKAMAAAVVN